MQTLKGLFDVLKSVFPVELLKEKVLFDLESKVLQADRVLHNVVSHPLVKLRLNDEIWPKLDLEVLGGLSHWGCRGGQGGGGTHRSKALGRRNGRSGGESIV